MLPYQEYLKKLRAAEMVAPLSSGLFGDRVSLYNGVTEFAVVDIDLPGNDFASFSKSLQGWQLDQRLPGNGALRAFFSQDLQTAQNRLKASLTDLRVILLGKTL